MALILILKHLYMHGSLNMTLNWWVIYNVKSSTYLQESKIIKSFFKDWSHFDFFFFFPVSEGIFYRTVNGAEWSFSDSEKYSWSQTLLSRMSSSFATIRHWSTLYKKTVVSLTSDTEHYPSLEQLFQFEIQKQSSLKNFKECFSFSFLLDPLIEQFIFLNFVKWLLQSSDLCNKSLSQSPNAPIWLICFCFGLWVGSLISVTFSKFTFVNSSPSVALCSIFKNNCISCNIMC